MILLIYLSFPLTSLIILYSDSIVNSSPSSIQLFMNLMIRSFIFVFVLFLQKMILILSCMKFGIILFMTDCFQVDCTAFGIVRICE